MRRLVLLGAAALGALWLLSCIYTERRLEGRRCQTDRDCLDGYVCGRGSCVEAGTALDGGPPDAGGPDADRGDRAAVDAELRDAVTADMAAVDAGGPDVASADSPALDATGQDSASADTSVLDAGGTTDGASAVDAQREDSPSTEDAPAYCGAVGHTCEIPPSASCSGAVLHTYTGPGECIADSCVFPFTETTCTIACDVDHCTLCGDGEDNGEACDDGNRDNGDGCSATCQIEAGWTCSTIPSVCEANCGDGTRVGPEACDEGSADSSGCNYAGGTGPYACTLAVCGDGYVNPAADETCDDGNGVDTDSCTTTCRSATCGDGHVWVGHEGCDDHNSLACGTCSADCQVAVAPRAASGAIGTISASAHVDGEIVTLNDGLHTAVVFEFDRNFPAQVTLGHERIDLYSNAADYEVAAALATAINNVGAELAIAASSNGNLVSLVHEQPGTVGNLDITHNVANAGFSVSGMSGGAARDCPTATGCMEGADCQSNLCSSQVCE